MLRATLVRVFAVALASLAVATTAATQDKPVAQEKPAAPAPDPRVFAVERRIDVTVGDAPRLAAGRDAVFVGSAETDLVAYAIDDGRELWRAPLTPESPLIPFDTLVGALSGGALHFLNQQTGRPAWRETLAHENEAVRLSVTSRLLLAAIGRDVRAFRPDGTLAWRQTFQTPPVTRFVENGAVLLAGLETPEIVALDAATGTVSWRSPVPVRPISLLASGDRIFFSASDFALHSYRVANGLEGAWRHLLLEAIGEPAADTRHVYVTLIDNTLRALSRGGGSQRWSHPLASRPVSGPMLGREDVFVALTNGEVAQLPAATGRPNPSAPAKAGRVVHLNAVAALPDTSAVFTITTAEDARSVLSVWRAPKPARKEAASKGPERGRRSFQQRLFDRGGEARHPLFDASGRWR